MMVLRRLLFVPAGILLTVGGLLPPGSAFAEELPAGTTLIGIHGTDGSAGTKGAGGMLGAGGKPSGVEDDRNGDDGGNGDVGGAGGNGGDAADGTWWISGIATNQSSITLGGTHGIDGTAGADGAPGGDGGDGGFANWPGFTSGASGTAGSLAVGFGLGSTVTGTNGGNAAENGGGGGGGSSGPSGFVQFMSDGGSGAAGAGGSGAAGGHGTDANPTYQMFETTGSYIVDVPLQIGGHGGHGGDGGDGGDGGGAGGGAGGGGNWAAGDGGNGGAGGIGGVGGTGGRAGNGNLRVRAGGVFVNQEAVDIYNGALVTERNTVFENHAGGVIGISSDWPVRLSYLANYGTFDNHGVVQVVGPRISGHSVFNNYGVFNNLATLRTKNSWFINGGTLVNDGVFDTSDGLSTGYFLNEGDLTGTGQVKGRLQNRGTFRPGHSPGVATITADYYEQGGTLEIEIEGLFDGGGDHSLTEYDWVEVQRGFSLNEDPNPDPDPFPWEDPPSPAPKLNIVFSDPAAFNIYDLVPGESTFDIVRYRYAIHDYDPGGEWSFPGTTYEIEAPGIWDIDYEHVLSQELGRPTQYSVRLTFVAVPEPSTLLMLVVALGLGGIGLWRRRTNQVV